MKLEHDFRVDADLETAWRVLLDLERIAPCMPGAQLQEVEGEEYRGTVKVKVGPITAQYQGVARIAEADDAAHQVVIRAEGRDTRGQGNATALITAALAGDGGGTRVHVDTDLNVTGKVAQFGRGVMADVSTKLLGQFVDCLGTTVLTADRRPASPPAASASVPAPPERAGEPAAAPAEARRIDAPEAEPVDLMRAAGGAVAKRVLPLAGVAVVAAVVVWLLVR
jgi:carbon monoxide dehydrogenase subunit G